MIVHITFPGTRIRGNHELEIEPQYFGRVSNALNLQAISPAPGV